MDTKNLEEACKAFTELSMKTPETGELIRATKSAVAYFDTLEEAKDILTGLDMGSFETMKRRKLIQDNLSQINLKDAEMMINHYKENKNDLLIKTYYTLFANICSSVKNLYDAKLM